MRTFYNNILFWGLFTFLNSFLATSAVAKKPVVVTITQDFSSIAQSIGKDKIQVISLVKGSKNLHAITPKPSMVIKVKQADLLIRLGMDQDSWIDGIIHVAKNKRIFPNKVGYLDASKNIKKLEVPTFKLDGSQGDVHVQGNPHYWLNPNNGKIIANDIFEHLSKIDPENRDFYKNNLDTFIQELNEGLITWKKRLKHLEDVRIITYHKTWSYFFEAFNLKAVGYLEPLPGIEPSTKHLARLSKIIQDKNMPLLVLTASYFPKLTGERFAKQHNGLFKYLASNVGKTNQNQIKSYFDLFDYISLELEK